MSHLPEAARSALAARFNDHELEAIASLGTMVAVQPGDAITKQGTSGRQAAIIVSGTASVTRGNTVPGDNVIATVGPGDIVGEMSLLTGQPRTATVVADTTLTVYALSPRDFSSLLAQCPRLAQVVTVGAVRRAAEVAAA